MYDFSSAQKPASPGERGVHVFIANSKNVAGRIKKFYRRDSTVIYPPVEVEKIGKVTADLKPENYYLIASRIVGAKGVEMAALAAKKAKFHLKIVGEPAGLRWFGKGLDALKNEWVEFIGRIPDEELYQYYGKCKAFFALATDEDFGVTPVEAMAAGRPVIAFRGGGYLETVIEGKTGVFFDKPTINSLINAIGRLDQLNNKTITPVECRRQARKFSKERFIKEIKKFVSSISAQRSFSITK
jgi:glycosyltransferase involved in cell wall biosynthesis